MGFPVDSTEDKAHQEMLANEINALTEVTIYRSPTTGLQLPVDAAFPPSMLYYFLVGDYEEHDMQLIRRYVRPGSKVLELGGGVGLTGSLLGQVSGNCVSVCEPNPVLHAYIERTFAANQVELNLICAAAVADGVTDERITFNACKDYWWSSLVSAPGSTPINVSTKKLSTLIQECGADTLLVDIEGYEVQLFETTEALASINTILVELHTPSIGTIGSARIITDLVKAGFSMVDMGSHTFVFSRHPLSYAKPGPLGRWY